MAAGRTILQTICAVIVLSIISALVEGQNGTVSPPTVAAKTGNQNTSISCTIQNPQGVESVVWQYNPTWSQHDFIIYTSFDNSNKDPANFSVATYSYAKQGVQHLAADLTIRVAKPGQAADYRCLRGQYLTEIGQSSFLVLDPIQCPAIRETGYRVGTTVNITCSVRVYSRDPARTEPIIDIIRVDQSIPLPGATTRNDTTVTTTSFKVLSVEDDDKKYVCVVRFRNNSPAYNDSCTMIYHVLHEVSNITFKPPSSYDNLTTVAVGDRIICTAKGRPAPTIVWFNAKRETVTEGEQLIISSEMQKLVQPITLLCRANNSIDGGLNYTSVEANYTFRVDQFQFTEYSTSTSYTTHYSKSASCTNCQGLCLLLIVKTLLLGIVGHFVRLRFVS